MLTTIVLFAAEAIFTFADDNMIPLSFHFWNLTTKVMLRPFLQLHGSLKQALVKLSMIRPEPVPLKHITVLSKVSVTLMIFVFGSNRPRLLMLELTSCM